MKNKSIYFMILVGLMIGFVCADTSYYEESNNVVSNSDANYISVSKLRYEPYPVSPGDYFNIWIQVEKSGTTKLDSSFELLEEYPFSLDSNEEAIRNFKSMGNEPIVLEYKVRVSDDAVNGVNTLKLRQILQGKGTIIHEFDIYVQDVQTSFDAVVQSSSDGELSIALANIGQNDANAAIVRIPKQDGVVVSGTNGQMIGNLEQGDYTVVGFDVSGKYSKLDLQIDYTDYIGVRRSEILEIPFDGSYGASVSLNRTMSSNGQFRQSSDSGASSSLSSWTNWVIWVFVFLVAGFLGYRYRKKINHEKLSSIVPEWVKKEKGAKK